MKEMKFINLAVFALFFGLALVQALQKNDWLSAALFLTLGALSLWADLAKERASRP